MSKLPVEEIRILAIDPYTKGFGFAVLEGPERLIDWGIKEPARDKTVRCLEQVSELIQQYEPNVVVVEEYWVKKSKRSKWSHEFIDNVIELAFMKKVESHSFSRVQVKQAFAPFGAHTKYAVASVLVEYFPELAPRLPPVRKPWMSEDCRMSIFDAISLAWAFLFFRLSATKS